ELSSLHGGVLGGALRSGKLKIGDEIEIKPGYSVKRQNKIIYQTVKTKIVSLQKGNHKITEALPGGSLAIETELDPSLTKSDSLSGCICSTPGTLPEITESIKIKFSLFDSFYTDEKEEKVSALKASEPLMLSVNTSTTIGLVTKIKNDEAEIALKIPVVPLKGDSIGIARNVKNHWRLIGFGEII
ncbi:translation initiation factor IF-2 subunit gamma, partial [archaeon]|nr:translation initiation factor IF-2 subunit gamma [archaeon]